MGGTGAGRSGIPGHAGAALCLAAALLATGARPLAAQDTAPILQLGISTGFVYNSNRRLEATSPGSSTELTAQLDFLMRFSTPIQQLELSGDIGLRRFGGAERDRETDRLFDPNLNLVYARQSRDAELTVNTFVSQRDVSSSELQFDPVTASFDLLQDTGTQLRFGFDTSLELRRRSPFGITLSAGYTGLRYSDTTDPSLTDQDRFRLSAAFRFDIDPATQATVTAGFRTFEDEGTAEGRRDTITLDAALNRDVRNGTVGLRAGATETEDGTRYNLAVSRSFQTDIWQLSSSLGLSRGVDGDLLTTGSLDLTRELPRGTITAGLSRSLQSGSEDEEQEVTIARFNYATQLTPRTGFDTGFTFTDRDSRTGTDDGQFATLSVGVSHQLSRDWTLNVDLQRRLADETTTGRAHDNRISVNLRRSLLARR